MTERGFYLETEDFDEKFRALILSVSQRIAQNGLYDAGMALLEDADNEAPQVPYRDADLRASRKREKIAIEGDLITVKVGYNSEYAAYQHEGERKDHTHKVKKYTTTQVSRPGKKFLESKMIAHKNRYMKICANYIKKKLAEEQRVTINR